MQALRPSSNSGAGPMEEHALRLCQTMMYSLARYTPQPSGTPQVGYGASSPNVAARYDLFNPKRPRYCRPKYAASHRVPTHIWQHIQQQWEFLCGSIEESALDLYFRDPVVAATLSGGRYEAKGLWDDFDHDADLQPSGHDQCAVLRLVLRLTLATICMTVLKDPLPSVAQDHKLRSEAHQLAHLVHGATPCCTAFGVQLDWASVLAEGCLLPSSLMTVMCQTDSDCTRELTQPVLYSSLAISLALGVLLNR